ncbi:HYDROLYZING O-GLYCOSYL COMPOUNDS putative-RELATED [Salix viminalis]|uniref:HYDROLYZING O-GLYCOSYL COMPOUNDS putative-RELATED n=1 Tax=Salix viminalis TaxID=40686 RepID=A0A9Q0NJR3_SALVM|nr:HYDROLYZING O-GLYCOSYL COMPOUNDS putative-RELATED [Salix viminalis]
MMFFKRGSVEFNFNISGKLVCFCFEMMKMIAGGWLLVLHISIFLPSVCRIHAVSYDYSATTECLLEPQRAQYEGGIISNPDFTHGIQGWTVFGQGAVKEGISNDGNRYIVAHSRSQPLDSISQEVRLEKGKLYSFSAWVQINGGRGNVAVVFKMSSGELVRGGQVTARNGCWCLLKGGVFANISSRAEILFESFTMEQWRSHQDESIDKERLGKVRFEARYANGTAIEGAGFSIKQTKSDFPFGCCMNYHIINSTDYQNWFALRFRYTTFTNEMKWYSTEKIQGQENYTVADAMVSFAQQNSISIRGHNIFWDNPKYQPEWVKNLTSDELRKAAEQRIKSVVSRYAGQLIAWDAMNENLHFNFFEDKLGKNASAEYYSWAYQLDPDTTMFLNEYNTIEDSRDEKANPFNYKTKLDEILSYPGNQRNISRHWINRIAYMAYRSGRRQRPESGRVLGAVLADKDFKNTPAGDVVDKLIDEWRFHTKEIKADGKGSIEIPLFHGDYNITVKDPVSSSLTAFSYKMTKDVTRDTVHLRINA